MKHFTKVKRLLSGLTLSLVVFTSSAAGVLAAPVSSTTPPTGDQGTVSGPQSKPPVDPGSKDAKSTAALGKSNLVGTNSNGSLKANKGLSGPLAGSVSGVDFQSPYNYCWKNLVYTPVKNTTSTTRYLQVRVYNNGTYHDIYTSVAAGGSITYPAFYGIDGSYYAYLYVWNGSSYQYDEYLSNTNTCNVSVTRTYNTGGWVQLKVQNYGTAYATQISSELAPFPAYGTYTGTQYDYPVAGGAAIYRWFYVGTSPYGIVSSTYGSFNYPYVFSGDL
jgi:hypothetical protein